MIQDTRIKGGGGGEEGLSVHFSAQPKACSQARAMAMARNNAVNSLGEFGAKVIT